MVDECSQVWNMQVRRLPEVFGFLGLQASGMDACNPKKPNSSGNP